MSKLLNKETGLIITSIIIFIAILMIVIKVPSTNEVSAEGNIEGAIQSESILVDGAVQNTITYANGNRSLFLEIKRVVPEFTTYERFADYRDALLAENRKEVKQDG